MENKEIMKLFLGKGASLDSAVLEYFSNNDIALMSFLEKATSKLPPIITLDYVFKTMGVLPPEIELKPIYPSHFDKKKVSSEDAVSKWTEKYSFYKKRLSDKMSSLFSINRTSSQQSFSLIAAVSEKIDKGTIEIEDSSGSLRVSVGKDDYEDMLEGDILGFECVRRPDGISVNRVVYPDIPLKREVGKSLSRANLIFVSNPSGIDASKSSECSGDKECTFVFMSAAPDNFQPNHVTVDTASIMKVSGITILMCPWKNISSYIDNWKTTENVAVNILKRRDILPGASVKDSGFWIGSTFLDDIPDIFVTDNESDVFSSNYKGVTILSVGGPANAWKIDLKTREINKADFS